MRHILSLFWWAAMLVVTVMGIAAVGLIPYAIAADNWAPSFLLVVAAFAIHRLLKPADA